MALADQSAANLICACNADAWTLTYVPGTTANIYEVTDATRNACYNYMAAYPCNYPATLTTYNQVRDLHVLCVNLCVWL